MDKETVAYHEAAHAVLVEHFGGSLKDVVLERDALDRDWEGSAPFQASTLTAERRVNVFLAGPLAEAKFLAARERESTTDPCLSRLLETIRFKTEDRLGEFLPTVFKQDRNDLHVQIGFVSESSMGDFEVRTFVGDFLDDVEFAKRATVSHLQQMNEIVDNETVMSSLHSRLLATRDLLDEPKIWAQVIGLARELTELEEREIRRAKLPGETAVHIMKNTRS